VQEHHEAGIHVVLLVAMKEGWTRVAGGELYLDLRPGFDQHSVFYDAVGHT
jgi:hypothetical protein